MTIGRRRLGALRRALAWQHINCQYRLQILRSAPIQVQAELVPAPLKPRIWWCDLDQITHHGNLRHYESDRDGYWSLSGDWDLLNSFPRPTIFEPAPPSSFRNVTHDTIRALFLENVPYWETREFKGYRDMIRRGERPKGCASEEALRRYFEALISIFESIQSDGYLTQGQLHGRQTDHEIWVYVTRDGRFHHRRYGHHRIRMAELLDVSRVPVLLKKVHPLWITRLSAEMSLPPHKAVPLWLEKHGLRAG